MAVIMGIDPGKAGGIGLVSADGDVGEALALPYMDKQLDTHQLNGLIDMLQPSRIVIEAQSYRPGQAGINNLLTNYGRLCGAVELSGIPFVDVMPSVWKKRMGIPPAKGKDAKAASYACAQRIWGHSMIIPPSKDGWVEALLLAEYGRREAAGIR